MTTFATMTPAETKKKLIALIKTVKNPELLEDLYRMLNLEMENMEELKTPANIKDSVTKGLWDIRNGRYMSNRQTDADIDKWLKK